MPVGTGNRGDEDHQLVMPIRSPEWQEGGMGSSFEGLRMSGVGGAERAANDGLVEAAHHPAEKGIEKNL